MNEKKAKIEAALFISSEPVSLKNLAEIIGLGESDTESLLEEIIYDMRQEHRGIELLQVGDHYQFKVKNEHIKHVSHLTPYADMGKGLLKVLALIVYKQPITQSDIVKTIGNKTYEYIHDLETRGLVKSEKWGRTKALSVTDEFMSYFGIRDRNDLIAMFQKGEVKEDKDDEIVGLDMLENLDLSKN